MAQSQTFSTFCVFCYQSIYICDKAASSAENIIKFTKFVCRLTKENKLEKLLRADNECEPRVNLKLQCCNECNLIIDSFCNNYHQFKVLELQMNWKLDQLTRKISHCNRVPSRWKTINAFLEETYPGDISVRLKNQAMIRKYRQAIEETCRQRMFSYPRVFLEAKMNIAAYPNITRHLTAQNNQVNDIDHPAPEDNSTSLILSDMECDSLDSTNEDNLEYSDNGKSAFVGDPFINVKLEAPILEDTISSSPPTNQQKETSSASNNSNDDIIPNANDTEHSSIEKPSEMNDIEPAQTSVSFKKRRFQSLERRKNVQSLVGIVKIDKISEKCDKICSDDNPNNENWNCADCELVFNVKKDLWLHRLNKHKLTVCLECGKEFKWKYNLPGHSVFHKDPMEWDWECSKCEKKFPQKRFLDQHMRIHNNTKKSTFKCPKCKVCFKGKRLYAGHRKNNSCLKDDTKILKCLECDLICNTKENLWEHRYKEHENKICTFCGREYKLTVLLRNHIVYHKDPVEWEYECIGCRRKCATKKKLKNHLAICKLYKVLDKTTIQSKVKEKNGVTSKSDKRKRFRCNKCAKFYTNYKISENHKVSHREGEFKCEFCPIVTTNVLKLSSHEYQNHGPGVKNEQDQKATESSSEDQWICPRCQFKSTCCADYQFHFAQTHFKLDEKALKSKNFTCETCGKMFASKVTLEIHLEGHKDKSDWKWECDKCGEKFPKKVALQDHLERHKDKKDWKWECDKCGEKFSKKFSLQDHLERHKDRKDWKWECAKCGHKFIKKAFLAVHMNCHTKTKNFPCPLCGRKFKHKANIKVHHKLKHQNAETSSSLSQVSSKISENNQ